MSGEATMRVLLLRAYDVKSYQLSGPAWMDTERYEIAAKIPAGATKEQVPGMLQALLTERFHGAVHRESSELSVYGLVVAKGGPKLKPAAPDNPDVTPGQPEPMPKMTVGKDGFPEFPPGYNKNSGLAFAQGMKIWSKNRTMDSLADLLSGQSDRPVLDMTGLQGGYEFTLSFRFERMKTASGEGAEVTEFPGELVHAAVQSQLGLKLEPRKAPVEILVVDQIEKLPTGN
jgi:uncharacterized protein (TIGR03435 family)